MSWKVLAADEQESTSYTYIFLAVKKNQFWHYTS
jgi:hypothetical protein